MRRWLLRQRLRFVLLLVLLRELDLGLTTPPFRSVKLAYKLTLGSWHQRWTHKPSS
jgi:hypothetical protein